MKTTRTYNVLFKVLGITIVLASFGGGWLVMDYRFFSNNPLPISGKGYTHVIMPGTSLTRFAADLHDEGMVSHPLYLRWLARLNGKAQSIKAGEYFFPPGTTPLQLLETVIAGDVVKHSLTIVEGWTFGQLLDAVHNQDALEQTLRELNPDEIMERLGYDGQHPEGRFLPDTYQYTRGMTDADFLQRAHQAMDQNLAQEWEKRDAGLPYQTPYQALIMASIVEKETAQPEERPQIAGVFVRRLKLKMKLQTDPTVIYAKGAAFDGNLRRKDLRLDSPYNTYFYPGLPPTPIALPGHAALSAALHPADGKALFFVSRGDGTHEFSATLAAHNAAVQRYQVKPHAAAASGMK